MFTEGRDALSLSTSTKAVRQLCPLFLISVVRLWQTHMKLMLGLRHDCHAGLIWNSKELFSYIRLPKLNFLNFLSTAALEVCLTSFVSPLSVYTLQLA